MLKKSLLAAACLLASTAPVWAQSSTGMGCGSLSPSQLSPADRAAYQKVEEFTQRYIREHAPDAPTTANRAASLPTLYTIPVVVHVFTPAAQAVTDALINSQITVLNADYSRSNSDANLTRAAFLGIAADYQVQFKLATHKPDGTCTNGIDRVTTTRTSFDPRNQGISSYPNPSATDVTIGNEVKHSWAGGADSWNSREYLNIWVCAFSGQSVNDTGFGTLPNTVPDIYDGVIINRTVFGVRTSGVYNKGRIGTHEVGHYLNLVHIWGETPYQAANSTCTDDDFVPDTPVQLGGNIGHPTTLITSCGNSGDMYENYMDYTYDARKNAFSNGQKSRSHAVLVTNGARAALVSGSAPALGSPTFTASTATNNPIQLCVSAGAQPVTFSVKPVCSAVSYTYTISTSPSGLATFSGNVTSVTTPATSVSATCNQNSGNPYTVTVTVTTNFTGLPSSTATTLQVLVDGATPAFPSISIQSGPNGCYVHVGASPRARKIILYGPTAYEFGPAGGNTPPWTPSSVDVTVANACSTITQNVLLALPIACVGSSERPAPTAGPGKVAVLSLSPNPANGTVQLTINGKSKGEIIVRTLTGTVVTRFGVTESTTSFDTRTLREGTYLVEFVGQETTGRQTLVVQH